MAINALNSANTKPQKRPFINLQNTGYTALATMGGAMVTGMSSNKTLRSSHKYFAWAAVVSSLAHLFIIWNLRQKR